MATATGPSTTPEAAVVPAPWVYDRSSLTGDFMVMIAGQTAEDFELHAPEMQFCEYADGIIYMPSPVTDRHQFLVGFLFHLLNAYHHEGGCGRVLMGPAVLRLSESRKFEPDIFVRPPGGDAAEGPKAVLAIEILSPSTRSHDLGLKREAYRVADLPETWFLDDRDKVVIVERRTPGGYERDTLGEGVLRSAGVPGFWLDVSWLWDDPLPNPGRCPEAILAGPPA